MDLGIVLNLISFLEIELEQNSWPSPLEILIIHNYQEKDSDDERTILKNMNTDKNLQFITKFEMTEEDR